MKMLYVANVRFPSERAHGAQIAKTCEALVREGTDLSLVIPARRGSLPDDPFEYYGLRSHFPIVRLFVLDTIGLGKLGFWCEYLQFAIRAYLYTRRIDADILYGRDEAVMYACSFGPVPVAWETHVGSWNVFARILVRRARKIIVISHGLKEFYVGHGVPEEKILVAHDGIDLDAFKMPESASSARARLGLPQDKRVALYIGGLGGWKGVETFMEASVFLPDQVQAVIIGGSDERIRELRKHYPRVMFLGARPYRELADNQAAADVLILPNTGRDVISARFTSPLKLFSYMAAGKPIVASDIPSIREILNDSSAVLVPPDEPRALASGIERALHPSASMLSARALQLVSKYDWRERARRILSCLEN